MVQFSYVNYLNEVGLKMEAFSLGSKEQEHGPSGSGAHFIVLNQWGPQVVSKRLLYLQGNAVFPQGALHLQHQISTQDLLRRLHCESFLLSSQLHLSGTNTSS